MSTQLILYPQQYDGFTDISLPVFNEYIVNGIDFIGLSSTTNYGTGSVVDSNVDNQGNCLFFNTNIIWLTDNSFNSTTYVTGQYTTG